jgi:hypothetical protein
MMSCYNLDTGEDEEETGRRAKDTKTTISAKWDSATETLRLTVNGTLAAGAQFNVDFLDKFKLK